MKTKCLTFLLLIWFTSIQAQGQAASPRKAIPAIARAAEGAVVSIVMSDKDGKPIAQGSGFLASKDGLIMTNYHVIAEGNSAVAKLPDGAFYVVDGVLAFDKVRDIALIRAHGQNFRTLPLGNSDRVQIGEEVVAIGNPLSLESTVSNGIVSGIRAVKEEGGKYLQITAPISPGSSGGPLFKMTGEVIGITTMHLKGGENLNFAIPINDAKRLLRSNSTKLQNLPNEQEAASTDVPPSTEEGQAGIAHHYYEQLLDAGAFHFAGKLWKKYHMNRTTEDYACFIDDPHSDTFFVFVARGYDQRYADAYAKWDKLMLYLARLHEEFAISDHPTGDIDASSDSREADKYYSQMQTIEETADYPYLRFLRPVDFDEYTPGAQKVYRDGARSLEADIYQKGVKIASRLYIGQDGGWWSSKELSRLSIEPSTMRYIMIDHRTPGKADWSIEITQAGQCEKISTK